MRLLAAPAARGGREGGQGVDGLGDVVDAEDQRARGEGRAGRAEAAREPALDALARRGRRRRPCARGRRGRDSRGRRRGRGATRRSRLSSRRLPKPMPGSTRIRSRAMPAARARGGGLGEEVPHLGGAVGVGGRLLHGPGLALHVHEDDGRAAPRRREGRHRGVVARGRRRR